MGTDIHVMVDRRNSSGDWIPTDVQDDVWEDRNYGAFGWMADVRNYSALEPRFADRGYPPDWQDIRGADTWHSATHFTVLELLLVDYCEQVEDRRYTAQEPSGIWNGGSTAEPGEGEKLPLGEFLGVYWMQGLLRLAALGDPKDTRVIIAFDS